MFIYCGFPSHCRNGMSAVVNPGNGQTLEAYRIAAATVEEATVPEGVFGGTVVAASGGVSKTSGSESRGVNRRGKGWVGGLMGGALVVVAGML